MRALVVSSCVCPVRLTALSCDSLVVCRQGVLVVLCLAQLQLVSDGGDRQEPPSGSIGSSTGRLQRRERPGGRGVLGVARGAGGARGGRGAPSHLSRKGKTVFRRLLEVELRDSGDGKWTARA